MCRSFLHHAIFFAAFDRFDEPMYELDVMVLRDADHVTIERSLF